MGETKNSHNKSWGKKKEFKKPEIEVIIFDERDVITSSGEVNAVFDSVLNYGTGDEQEI